MSAQAHIDANVILRFLTNDPPAQAAASAALFKQVEDGDLTLFLEEIVAAEVVWVLRSFYGRSPSDVASVLQDLVAHDGILADDKEGLLTALQLFSDHNVDFADALTAAHMGQRNQSQIYSFDTHFDRLPGINRRLPGDSAAPAQG